MSKHKDLPSPYPALIERAINKYHSIFKDDLAGILLCGGCARGSIHKNYSDIDFLLLLYQGHSDTIRYIDDKIKISAAVINLGVLGNPANIDVKILYFLRCYERESAFLLHGQNGLIPNIPFQFLKNASSNQNTIGNLIKHCELDVDNLTKSQAEVDKFKIIKHHHAFMKNMLRTIDIEQDDYSIVNETFYSLYPSSSESYIPTPSVYLKSKDTWTNDIIIHHSKKFLDTYRPKFIIPANQGLQ